jgi:hypothetical protein
MSYSMFEPEQEPICECKYDPVHDTMDREDCFFHCDGECEPSPPERKPIPNKPAPIENQDKEDAA